MRRVARAAAAAGGLGLAALGLTACNQPLPDVTILSDKTTVTVKPQEYCFDGKSSQCHFVTSGNVPTLSAHAGATLFIDVPKAVADNVWRVTTGHFPKAGTFQAYKGDGISSGLIRDRHSTRINVPYNLTDYYVAIQQVAGDAGTWVAEIKVHG